MTPLVPVMLFGWVPFTIFLFFTQKPHRAVLISLIGGWLLLPTADYNLPGIPAYGKNVAISLGLISGGWFSGQRGKAEFKLRIYDLPMVLWCLSPIPTSLINHLGFYDAMSGFYGQVFGWGIPYFTGRIYFKNDEALKDLCRGIVIGGIIYAALCLYEIRMSPQLSNTFYGFFPHEWRQHKRYGGWRPIVFMQHGLMVAVWMATAASASFWLWRSRAVERIMGIPMFLVTTLLIITALLCKSANGWIALALGCGGYFIYRRNKSNGFLVLLLLFVPFYIGLRITGTLTMEDMVLLAGKIFDSERTGSLGIRLYQEDLFTLRALESPVFGWGGYSRGWPVNPETGEKLIGMVDAMWIIVFSSKGFFGIGTLVVGMLMGPWVILRATAKKRVKESGLSEMMAVMLSLIVTLFMVDSLFNGMVNPIYIMISGALLCWHLAKKQSQLEAGQVNQRQEKRVTNVASC